MPTSRSVLRLVPLVAVLTLAACSSTQPVATSSDRVSTQSAQSPEEIARLEALYDQRKHAEMMNFVQADVDFMTGMIGHHAQALIMSDLAPKNDASPAVQRLAARIINAQKDEIATMQTWLRDRNQPVPEVEIDGLMLMITMVEPEGDTGGMDGMDNGAMDGDSGDGMDHAAMGHGDMDGGMHDHSSMPGMLSQAQLEELAGARGADFDRLFLAYMIQHHQGATTMVDDLLAVDGAASGDAAFKLASDINVDQVTEIARMQKMLDRMTGSQ